MVTRITRWLPSPFVRSSKPMNAPNRMYRRYSIRRARQLRSGGVFGFAGPAESSVIAWTYRTRCLDES